MSATTLEEPPAAGAAAPRQAGRRYAAFISYSSRDRRWADWLHRSLERYTIPMALRGRPSPVGPIGVRLPPLFQDRKEFAASADLGASIRDALALSSTLIVVCSPASAASPWVDAEIRAFKASGRGHLIQCVIVDGEPNSADSARCCFPPALREDGTEPLASDVRREGDGKQGALLKLLAGLLNVGFDDLRQRDLVRRHRQLVRVAAASSGGLLLTTALALAAVLSRNDAVKQRDVARQKTLTAERTVEFVKSLFEVSDPSEARGSTITAAEILDRGATRIDQALDNEPNVKAELTTTLSEVYQGLGLYRRGDALIQRSLLLNVNDPATKTRQYFTLGNSQARQGKYVAAVATFRTALARIDQAAGGTPIPESAILIGLGEALAALEKYPEAEAAIRRALASDLGSLGPHAPEVARDLEALALTKTFAGDYRAARRMYERASAIRLRAQGADHPRISENLNALGSIAYLQGDARAAEDYWKRTLRLDRKVLGPEHPDVAATLSNIARVMVERRGFDEARPLLERAVAINLAQRDDTHDDLAFTFCNLGLALRGQGHTSDAITTFRRALRAAEKHGHRNLAPVLTDLAEALCASLRFDEAARLLDRAAPIMRADYPDDPWRSAWVESTRGDCLFAAGDSGQAAPLIRRSSATLLARWPASSLYGLTAARRLRALPTT